MVTDSQAAKFRPITPIQLIIEVNDIYAGLLWWKPNVMNSMYSNIKRLGDGLWQPTLNNEQ
jgi:hypothetical protein